MKSKVLLNIFLATTLALSSTVSVFASVSKSTPKVSTNVTSRNYTKSGEFDKKDDINKYANIDKTVAVTKVVSAVKDCVTVNDDNVVKDSVPNKDYNLGKDMNIGSAVRAAQEKAKEIVKEPVKETPPKVEISQELKDQIKAEYTAMRATEVTNKAIFVTVVNKKNQVVSYINKVAQGKITYTDAQLTQLDFLSVTFQADIKAVTDATVLIKADEAAVKASATSKDFDAVLAGLKTEVTARVARGTALTKVSQDLDAFLLVLVEGQAVLPTPVTSAN